MKSIRVRTGLVAAAMMLTCSPGWTQQPPAAPEPATTPAAKTFSQQDLDQILAPVALYPDALLAQILMASTYPLEIVEAARWAKANPNIKGTALPDALQKQTWDPSVKSLATVPQVLGQMNDKLDWTQKLGDAFLAQQKEVMATVQSLRAKAHAAGNLKSTEQQVVKSEKEGTQTIYVIESSKPEVIYVPTYNPYVVYGTWWYPYPPYYMYPPHYVYPPGVAFATGVVVGAAIWGSCNWHHGGSVYVNVNHYNSFNRTTINNPNWNHNVDHRKGVAYRDQKVAQQYNRGSNAQAAKAREEFRGRTETQGPGRDQFEQGARQESRNAGSRDTAGAGQSQARTAPADRSGGSFADTRGNYGGFSGAGSGASARAASARGNVSMSRGGGRR